MATRRLVEIVLQGKDQTQGAFDSLAESLGVTNTGMLKVAASAAAVATGVATATKVLYDFTAEQARAGDAAAKFAYRLGLSVESVSELEYIAKRGGVAVNTMGMALQRMVRRVAEAAQGTGEARDAIRELGIEAATLTTLSPDQQFYQIAEALQQVEGQSDRVRLAFKLFDSEGVAVIQTLKNDIGELTRDFERFGGAMSSSFAEGSESFVDAGANLELATKRLKEALAEPFLAPFTKSVNTLAASLQYIGAAQTGVNATLATLGGPLGVLGNFLNTPAGGGREPSQVEQWAAQYGTGQTVAGAGLPPSATVPSGPYNPGAYAPNPYWTAPQVMDIEPDQLGLVSMGDEIDQLTAGMDELVGSVEGFGTASQTVAATFQSAMGQAFASAMQDVDNFADYFVNVLSTAISQIAGQFLAAGFFSMIGAPVTGPFAAVFGGGKSMTVSGDTKAMPSSADMAGMGGMINAASGAYEKAFV